MLTQIKKDDHGVTVLAPAKINIGLAVTGKRSDGYHLLRTIMRKVPIYDRVTVTPSEEKGIILNCSDDSIPNDERNLAYKAAKRYASLFPDRRTDVIITLKKGIPHGAGMGGGSSDCAAVLIAMHELFGKQGEDKEILLGSAALGADVPFFVNHTSDHSLCEGIGEIMTDIPRERDEIFCLIAKECEGASTKEIFSLFDSLPTREASRDGGSDTKIFSRGTAYELSEILHNDLEEAATRLIPRIEILKKRLIGLGAIGSVMTGSGSAVFGIFPDEDSSLKGERILTREGIFARAVRI